MSSTTCFLLFLLKCLFSSHTPSLLYHPVSHFVLPFFISLSSSHHHYFEISHILHLTLYLSLHTIQKIEKKNSKLQELVEQSLSQINNLQQKKEVGHSYPQKKILEEGLDPTTIWEEIEKKEKVEMVQEQLLERTREIAILDAELKKLKEGSEVLARERQELSGRLASADSVCAMQREAFQGGT